MSGNKELSGLITGLVALLATACFMIIGLLTGVWHPTWMVFLIIPVTGIIGDALTKGKEMTFTGLVAILAAGVFLVIGFLTGRWHPAWLVFFAIPIFSIIESIVRKKEPANAIIGVVAILCAAAFLVAGFFFSLWHIAWVVFLLIPIVSIVMNIVKVVAKKDENADIS